jgi:hypothetical protein
LLSFKFFYHQNYVITIVLYLVLCKINILHNTYSSFNVLLKNQNPKFNLMNFEFLNFHISHLTKLGMINITLKCQKKTYVKTYLTWFLVPIFVFAPVWALVIKKIKMPHNIMSNYIFFVIKIYYRKGGKILSAFVIVAKFMLIGELLKMVLKLKNWN